MLFRPAESSKDIADFYRRYLISTFRTNRDYYNKQLAEQLSEDGAISNGPFISMSDSFAKDKSIRELVEEGVLCKSMLELESLHLDRKLYRHQVQAIRKAIQGKNLVITTGTGSGKTECFMLPILNQLLLERQAGTLDAGVRTLIVYPMNALVNDQMDRLRKTFANCTDTGITFGRFTGETEETGVKARSAYFEREGVEPSRNELISREQMRCTPPNILITNYAMLEYLLLRPGDTVCFRNDNADKWKWIVLDEAHTYDGAKGIEVASLLKRVTAMLHRDTIRFVLTSATLGNREDDGKIVGFARSLCNTQFDADSVIRSTTISPKRPENTSTLDFAVYRELAVQLRDNCAHEQILRQLRNEGIPIVGGKSNEESLGATLFSMIQHDDFYYRVREELLNKTRSLNDLEKDLGVSVDDVADFIAVASNAQLEGDKIFEARYHMFLRGIEGVFITLSPSNKLFLKRMEAYTEETDGSEDTYKAYEISFCHNCDAIFIVGQTDADGHLVQVSKFDDEYAPEVYLIDDTYDLDAEEEEVSGQQYLLCSKCGAIARESSLNGLPCAHGKSYRNRIIKVKDAGAKLCDCPCCHAVNTQRGILRPYFLGNEAATAVIATALYNALPNTVSSETIIEYKDEFFGSESEERVIREEKHLTKQFLAFSDNRQAAAFFASYLNNTYQNTLLKRLMTQVYKENRSLLSKGLSLSAFVEKLEEQMTKYSVCEENKRHKQAWITVALEMINYKARNSLLNEGTLYFDYVLMTGKSNGLGLTEEETVTLFKILIQSFAKDGAFHVPVLLTDADYANFSHGNNVNGYQRDYSTRAYTKSWLPKRGKENRRTRLIMKMFPDRDLSFAEKLLTSIWEKYNAEKAISFDGKLGKYMLNLEAVIVKAADSLWICRKCRTVTPNNFRDICTCDKCSGTLIPYDAEVSKKNDHYKWLYENLRIDTLVAKEHTAQLGSKKAYDYQNDFKKKDIHVLSCSTTFEMGVDLGSLETVFMRNMPPTPANYAQRAGRAGRSVKSAAYALTYCPNNSHDLYFFRDPTSMIKGTIVPPTFNVNNEKIVLRHIFASAFSFFWRKYPDLYKGKIGDFMDAEGPSRLQQYLRDQPSDLRDYLKHAIPPALQDGFDVEHFGWAERLFSEDAMATGVFVIASNKYRADIMQLQNIYNIYNERLRSFAPGANGYNEISHKCRSVNSSIRTIRDQRLISFLSQNNLIPKYGFPVDTVELKSIGHGDFMNSLQLDRDLFSAISEYAPGSQVVADGKLITSRYVRRLSGYEWPKYNYVFCDHCKTLNKTLWAEDLPKTCKQCGRPLSKARQAQYIIPKFGFVVDNAEPEPAGTSKPERTYKGSISYIGDGDKIENESYSICGKNIVVGTSRMDELAVLNTSHFYVCNECGYGEVFDDCHDRLKVKPHDKSDGYKCSNDKLTPYSLGHEFQTDVVQIKFETENITQIEAAWTILYALLEGLSRCLHIDRNELSGCLHWYSNTSYDGRGNYDFILFDNTPGGAGYVRNLRDVSVILEMMKEGMRIVSECTCGGKAADTACYSCLCNYYNQKQHDILQRRYAIEFFRSMMNGMDNWYGAQLKEDPSAAEPLGLGLRAEFNNDGLDQSERTYSEIWDYLKMDTDNLQEREIISALSKTFETITEKPYYGGSIRVIESGRKIPVDLLWKKSRIALFLLENSEGYEAACDTDWEAFCITEGFEPKALLEHIAEG